MAAVTSRLAALDQAADELVREEYAELKRTYGTDRWFREGWSAHNASHGLLVSNRGGQGAEIQVSLGRLPPEAVPLMRIAGIFHDHVQVEDNGSRLLSPRREELSVARAWVAMQRYEATHGLTPGELFRDEDYAFVERAIMATKKVRVDVDDHSAQIVQNVIEGDLAGAVLADADMSPVGTRLSLYNGVLLSIERLYHPERELDSYPDPPRYSDGRDIAVDRERFVPELRFQGKLLGVSSHGERGHQFVLPESTRLYPGKPEIGRILAEAQEAYKRGDMDFPTLIEYAARVAGTPLPPRDEARRAPPADLQNARRLGDLVSQVPVVGTTRSPAGAPVASRWLGPRSTGGTAAGRT